MHIAVITGAASGIGLALSQVHLQKGDFVIMVDKDHIKLKNEVENLLAIYPEKILSHSCDVTDPHEVNQLAHQVTEQFNQIDYIYNNAGIIGQLSPVWDLAPDTTHKVMEVNLYGMIHVIQAFLPFLFQQNVRSHIINMGSLYSLCAGSQTASYSMSKHAVLALSESLHFDLQRLEKPVDVSIVFPSFTDTGLLANNNRSYSSFQGALSSLLSRSRPAMELAECIVHEVSQKKFYIFPDKEVKGYCEERTQALILQEAPHRTNIEKLLNALLKRQETR